MMRNGKKELIFLGVIIILTLDILINLVKLRQRISDIEYNLDFSQEQVVNQFEQLNSKFERYISDSQGKDGDTN